MNLLLPVTARLTNIYKQNEVEIHKNWKVGKTLPEVSLCAKNDSLFKS